LRNENTGRNGDGGDLPPELMTRNREKGPLQKLEMAGPENQGEEKNKSLTTKREGLKRGASS